MPPQLKILTYGHGPEHGQQEEKNGSFYEWDFGTLWTQLGSQKFKTEELPINVPAHSWLRWILIKVQVSEQ